jgi:hypothetical protein
MAPRSPFAFGLSLDLGLKEAATALGCSQATVRSLVRDGHLQGRKVPGPSGVDEWRFAPEAIAAADRHRQTRRDGWRPRMLSNLARGRRVSVAARRLRAAARDEVAEVEKLAGTVAGRLGPARVRAILEGALR